MLDSYHLFFVSISTFFILSLFLIFSKFVYPKRELNPLFVVILFSLLPVISIFRVGTYQSGDFSLHIYETMSFFDNLREGILIPRWGAELNATYGYPIHLFAYPLPRYILSFFVLLGFSFITSLKLFLAFSYIASGIAMYAFVRHNLNRFAAAVASIFYLFAPYHLVDLHYRVAIGEVLAFVFIPLVFLFTQLLLKKPTIFRLVLLSLLISLLVLSHQAISLATVGLLFLFVIFLSVPIRRKLYFVLAFIYSLCLSAFYVLPVLFEKQYTLPGLLHESVAFESLSTLLYSPWRFGMLFQGPQGELALIVGYIHLVAAFFVMYLLFTKRVSKKSKQLGIFFLVSFFLFIFLITRYSSFLWNLFPIAKDFQFAYRLLAPAAFASSFLAGVLAFNYKRRLPIYIVTIFAMLITILNWGNRTMIPNLNDEWHRGNIPRSTAEGEGNGQSAPKWVDPIYIWEKKIPPSSIEIIRGTGKIKQIQRTSLQHEFVVNAQSNLYLKENTLFFPGWTVYVNNKQIPLTYAEKNAPGIIHFHVDKGLHSIRVIFEKTMPRKVGELVSFFAFLLILLYGGLSLSRRIPQI